MLLDWIDLHMHFDGDFLTDIFSLLSASTLGCGESWACLDIYLIPERSICNAGLRMLA